MVFKKRLDYGFNAFNVHDVPRAPRSMRRRSQSKCTVEESQFCAFEMLASLAGKLLQESESSASGNASEGHECDSIGKNCFKQEIQYEDKPLKPKCFEQGRCEASVAASELTTENGDDSKDFRCAKNNAILECTLTKTDPACSEEINGDLKYGSFPGNVDGHSPYFGESYNGKTENAFKQERDPTGLETQALNIANKGPPKDPVNFDRVVKLLSRRDPVPSVPFTRRRNDIKLGSRDDEENFSRLKRLSKRFKASRPPTHIGDRRIRKLLTSKYWKVAAKLKDFEHSRFGGKRPLYCKRKTYYNYHRCQYDMLYKQRKIFDRKSVTSSPEKDMNGDKCSTAAMSDRVKFSIKSFRIPELYIEVPETATVGSLKRTVMEAVTALIGGGIRVGLLLQGKKVRDDSRALSQAGISCDDNLDALGFTLEPGPAKAPPTMCSEEPPLLLSYDAALQNLTSSLAAPAVNTGIPNCTPNLPFLTNSENPATDHEPVSSKIDMPTDQSLLESRALVPVPVPATNVEALTAVAVNQKFQKSELAQRRIWRPFSISEVEALVQAVEEIGTGRWRDIKLRAFESADHRTYVNLKDKWKTLVHTAKISLQQRRGDPVPQELLDRVLVAHAYWAQHQAKKQQSKLHHHRHGTPSITDTTEADRKGVARVPIGTM
ncbi:Telomere repeat-binding 3 -like protein [Gossypium arboreum]|uniref:Telomere repeat-binding 3-like protein n=1 Tax=Gossypium arboreum TaxID=29729 RepID=A0A0B0NWP1_GOSAR|nr:telomere repeat-binding protein 3 [Gossypium arboreum]XP_052885926.1 telomere repeat-binding protein 3 [Gossypium arboreum]KHG15516.1 Telomere repeat-binding 3 -like protein [Gossypium arboreum]